MMARYYGYNPPFVTSNSVLPRQEDVRLISNDLLQLLLTTPGERIHRPDFGTLLRTSVFEPFTFSTLNDIRLSILNAIRREEPRLTDVVVELIPNVDKLQLTVRVFGNVSSDPNIKLEIETSVTAPGVASIV